jgi:hypothetical protein
MCIFKVQYPQQWRHEQGFEQQPVSSSLISRYKCHPPSARFIENNQGKMQEHDIQQGFACS